MSSNRCTLYVFARSCPHRSAGAAQVARFKDRLKDHRIHLECSVVEHYEVPVREASRLEDEKTIELMRAHGWQGVRGGNFTCCQGGTWWLPVEFQPDQVNAFGLYH